MHDVDKGTVPSKTAGKSGLDGYVEHAVNYFIEYMPWSAMVAVLALVFLIVGIVSCITPGEDLRPPYKSENPSKLGQTPTDISTSGPQNIEPKKEK